MIQNLAGQTDPAEHIPRSAHGLRLLALSSVREEGPLRDPVPVGRRFRGGYHGTPNIS
jgi:hypothetical protein